MKEPQTEFGLELRKLRREELKWTQARLSECAGISAAYVSQLETGDKPPTLHIIRTLSGCLGVLPNRLFRTINMVEMDLASTLASHRDQVRATLPDLPDQETEELANYLTYLEFKASALG